MREGLENWHPEVKEPFFSVVTGTLNRRSILPQCVDNTVNAYDNLELVILDGGSNDGTVEYLKSLDHERIHLIEIGHTSSWPHFMNLGIQNSKYD